MPPEASPVLERAAKHPGPRGQGRIRPDGEAAVNAARAAGDGVYVDHGEAYGNLGEEAMILTALARFRKRFQPRVIYVTHAAGEHLPVGHLPTVRSTPSPFR